MNLKSNIEIMENFASMGVYSSFDFSDREPGKCIHPLLNLRAGAHKNKEWMHPSGSDESFLSPS